MGGREGEGVGNRERGLGSWWCGGTSGTNQTLLYDNSADYLLVIEQPSELPRHLSLEHATTSSSRNFSFAEADG